MKRSMVLLASLTMLTTLTAQDYKYEGGLSLGIGSAYGDLNQGRFFYSPSFETEFLFRYNKNMRWAYTAELMSTGLRGNSDDFANRFPNEMDYAFNRRLWQLGGSLEFNFLNYGWGYDYLNCSRFSPFLVIGAGLGVVSGDGKPAFSFAIPLGAGVKYKFAPRWNAVMKITFAKMLTDKADQLNDLYDIESTAWKNTDWYSTLSVGVTYEFGFKRRKCNNLD